MVKNQEMKVQLLEANAVGAAKKYTRLCGLKLVKYPFQTVSLANIIEACKSHYRDNGKLTTGNTVHNEAQIIKNKHILSTLFSLITATTKF